MGDHEDAGAERQRADDALSARISGYIAAIEAAVLAEQAREAELRGRLAIMEARISQLEVLTRPLNGLARFIRWFRR